MYVVSLREKKGSNSKRAEESTEIHVGPKICLRVCGRSCLCEFTKEKEDRGGGRTTPAIINNKFEPRNARINHFQARVLLISIIVRIT